MSSGNDRFAEPSPSGGLGSRMTSNPYFARPPWRRRAVAWGISFFTLAGVTAGMLSVRPQLDKSHVALVYLLIVLLGSAGAGRLLGLTLSALAFLSFDWFFLPPYDTLVVANPLDWLVLAAFLITSVVAAQLLARAQQGTEAALARAAEVQRLSALGAETLNAARPEDALVAIAEVIRGTLGVDACDVYALRETGGEPSLVAHARALGPPTTKSTPNDTVNGSEGQMQTLLAWATEQGRVTIERLDGTLRVVDENDSNPHEHVVPWSDVQDARVITIPLRIRSGNVGALRITNERGIELEVSQREFLDALSYYAALGVERIRLAAHASHAELLREADRLKNALLAAVSHDLRTPLTTIKALAHELAERGARPGDPAASSIEEEVDRLTSLVTDLLDLSRLTGGAIQLRPAINTADDLIGAALQRTHGVLAQRAIRIVTEEGQAILVGRFDFVQSLRVLVNLIENAIKYSPPNAEIEVSVHHDGGDLFIAVADRGLGVPVTERERIFEPFYRAPGVPADTRGAGLGLAIARGLAIAQGGNLRYEPRSGGGSVFILGLPGADALPVTSE